MPESPRAPLTATAPVETPVGGGALVVANPKAGSARPALLDAVRQRCAERVREVTTVCTDAPDAAVGLVERALTEASTAGAPLDLVVSVGGDGTARDVAEGIARGSGAWPDGGKGEVPALLIVPSGSGNSAYRALWGDRPWDQALAEALTPGGSRRQVFDLARVVEDDRATLLGYNAGLLGRIAQVLQTNHGKDRYRDAIGQALEDLAAYPQRVTVDDRVLYEGPTMMTTVGGMGRFGQANFNVLPHAVLDDALLDVCVIGEVGRADFGEYAALIAVGRHVGHPQVEYAQGRRVRIERLDGEPLVAEYDGDPCAAGPVATIEVVPAAFGALAAPE